MDLDVNFHGLKYNFRKVQGVKCKNIVARGFSKFLDFFF
jgi:hypothetical protein